MADTRTTAVLAGDWRVLALHDLEHSDLSYTDIAKKYGRSRDVIIQLKRQAGIERPSQGKGGPKPLIERDPISPQHKALGIRLTMYRGDRTTTELSDVIGVSRHTVRCMELGVHDFTLSEIQKLSHILGVDFVAALTPHQVPSYVKR